MLKIKELREEMQMTQKQLAEKISNMQRNVSNWEQGVSEPDLRTVVAIADVFGVTLDELFDRQGSFKNVAGTQDEDAALVKCVKRLSKRQKSALWEMLKSFGVA